MGDACVSLTWQRLVTERSTTWQGMHHPVIHCLHHNMAALPKTVLHRISGLLDPTSRMLAASTCKGWGALLDIVTRHTPEDKRIPLRMCHAMMSHYPVWCEQYAVANHMRVWGPRLAKLADQRLRPFKGNTLWKTRTQRYKAIKANHRERKKRAREAARVAAREAAREAERAAKVARKRGLA